MELAFNFDCEGVAGWLGADVHVAIMDAKKQAGHGYGVADSRDVFSTPLV